ncbi:MAG: radical SAM protein [Mobilitalea sp.]
MNVQITRLDHDKKIFSYTNWMSIKDILYDRIKSKFGPILTLDLTEKCNFFCEYCIDEKNTNKHMAKELDWYFLHNNLPIMRQRGCRAIELAGGGEPTLYSHFAELIELAAHLNYSLSLITNGSLLLKYSEEILKSDFDWIRVSLDAANPDTHKKVHSLKQDIFHSILEGIAKIAPQIPVGVSFIINEDNCEEIYSAAKLAKQVGARYIEFKPMLQGKQILRIDNIYQKISMLITDSHSLQDNKFSVITTHSLELLLKETEINADSMRTEEIHELQENKQYSICYSCYLRTVLTPSGLYPCSYYRGSEYRVTGCMDINSIIEARNKLIQQIDPKTSCGHYCARHQMNVIVDKLIRLPEEYSFLVDHLGWPVDYGEDSNWL